MTDEQIKAMILEVIQEVDYDTYKNFLPECSEDPEYAEEEMTTLIDIVKKHLDNAAMV